jgi:hypothetical protein
MKKETTKKQKIRIKDNLNSNFAGMTFMLHIETTDRYFANTKLSFLKSDCELI